MHCAWRIGLKNTGPLEAGLQIKERQARYIYIYILSFLIIAMSDNIRVSTRDKKGQDQRIRYEDEQAAQQQPSRRRPRAPKQPPKQPPKRQPKKQPVQPIEEPKTPIKTPLNIQNAPVKTKKTEARTLQLDLPEKPPNEDIKFR
jgi:hypothetical protein